MECFVLRGKCYTTCSYFLVAVIIALTKNNLGREGFSPNTVVIIEGSQVGRRIRKEPEACPETETETTAGVLLPGFFSTQFHLPKSGTTLSIKQYYRKCPPDMRKVNESNSLTRVLPS